MLLPHRLALAAVALLAVALPGRAEVGPEVSATDRRLLAETNLFATVPAEFRARLALSVAGSDSRSEIEVWRGGRDRLLARPLAVSQAGKLLLQIGADRWLITPGAKKPVRLGAGLKLHGGLSFEEILGIDLERGWSLERVERPPGAVTFHLAARPETAAAGGYAAARWVVDPARRLPVRLDLLIAGGRVARVVEFPRFRPGRPPVPERIVLKDVVRGGPPLAIEIVELEARPVPAALFDLEDGSAREALLAGKLPPGGS